MFTNLHELIFRPAFIIASAFFDTHTPLVIPAKAGIQSGINIETIICEMNKALRKIYNNLFSQNS